MLLVDYMKRKTYIIFTLCYAALIFVISSFPMHVSLERGADKTLHVIEYSILGFLTLGCFKNRNLLPILIFAILISSLYGISDEIHQHFVPGREFSILDIVANSIGSLFGVLINFQFYRKGLIT